MYLQKFTIENIKCFEHVEIHFPNTDQDFSGWNVLLGGNGMGKSTLLQAMAVGLVGPLGGQRLLLNPAGWVRADVNCGKFEANIVKGEQDSAIGQPRQRPYRSEFAVTGTQEVELGDNVFDQPQVVQLDSDRRGLAKGPYAAKSAGWFACGYGPFRRLSGGSSEIASLVFSAGPTRRFVTLFFEAAALTDCTEWLVSLYSRSIDKSFPNKAKAKADLVAIRAVIDGLLPGDMKINRIDSQNVFFRTIGGAEVSIPELSDGYRSFLAFAIDMLRHLQESVDDLAGLVTKQDGKTCIAVEGVALIDEVDAHLHPFWQRQIGFLLRQAFPKMQFIVTSHSPFVAQAASDGGLLVLRPSDDAKSVCAVRPVESIRGWRVDQILTSPLFGLAGTRDDETERLMHEHSRLVAKREWGKLSTTERQSLANLEEQLSNRLTAPGESAEERTRQQEMSAFVKQTLESLK